MPSVTEELNLSLYFLLINFHLNSHICLVVTILDKEILEGELFKGMKLESKREEAGLGSGFSAR